MKFVANLRNETIDAFGDQGIQPAAYLLSSHRITPSTLEAAAVVRGLGLPLFADNGTKPSITDTINRFKDAAEEIRLSVKALRKEIGEIPRGKQVPPELRDKSSNLADEVIDHATEISEAIDSEALLKAQLSMNPTDLIAQEDFATACLIGLGLERETTGWSISRFDTRNRRSLRLWKRVAEDPRCNGIRVYAVLSAMDYNTARSAGRLAAASEANHLALGIAGITLDPSATDSFVMGRASLKLEKVAPRRYVRLAQIMRGLAEGYLEAGGNAIQNFHCLGLGAPFLLPIPPAAHRQHTHLTTDATSPIHDAVRDRVLYDPEKDGDRASTREIVQRIVNGGNWPFLSPFSQAFREQFGHRPEDAREAWEALGRPAITHQLLETDNDLTDALPLFAEADEDLRKIALRTHIAHNHWVLGRITEVFDTSTDGRREIALVAIVRAVTGASMITGLGLRAALQVLNRNVLSENSQFGRG